MADEEDEIRQQGITLAAVPGGVLLTLHGLKEEEGEVLQVTMDPTSVRQLANGLLSAADQSTELLVREFENLEDQG